MRGCIFKTVKLHDKENPWSGASVEICTEGDEIQKLLVDTSDLENYSTFQHVVKDRLGFWPEEPAMEDIFEDLQGRSPREAFHKRQELWDRLVGRATECGNREKLRDECGAIVGQKIFDVLDAKAVMPRDWLDSVQSAFS